MRRSITRNEPQEKTGSMNRNDLHGKSSTYVVPVTRESDFSNLLLGHTHSLTTATHTVYTAQDYLSTVYLYICIFKKKNFSFLFILILYNQIEDVEH